MSTGIVVKNNLLRNCLSDITPLFPKGSNIIPLGFFIDGNNLTITCTSGCIYQCLVPIENREQETYTLTIKYRNILDFIPTTGDTCLDVQPYGVTLEGDGYAITLTTGYSVVNKVEIPDYRYTQISHKDYLSGLRDLLNMNLSDVYRVEKPITVYKQVAVLKYPNLQVQARTLGLPFTATLTPDHIKLLVRFDPTEVCDTETDILTFKRKGAILQLPRETVTEENTFMESMKDLSEPVKINTSGYADKLRNMNKTSRTARCKIVIHEEGLASGVNVDNIDLQASLGNIHSTVKKVTYLPVSLWLMCIRALDGSVAEILYEGDIICIRNQSVIILLHALR